jgi:glycosyltransferase involved in cell wall biosynthesis
MIIASIITLYALLLLLTALAMHSVPYFNFSDDAKTGFSIIIPFKDEENNLLPLLKSLQNLNYPAELFEIIMVDDHSEDNFCQIINQFNNLSITLLNNNGVGKKSALEKGISQAKNNWIITTDADCELPTDWLSAYNAKIVQSNAKMILAPVVFVDDNSFLQQFQQIEFLSLQALTMASYQWKKPFLSNGANLGFQKNAFLQVNGYEGNKQIASGDDVFLLEKFQLAFPHQIEYLKTRKALVKTQAQKDWKSLLQQKVRWGGKTKNYKSTLPKIIGALILIANFSVLICFALGTTNRFYFWIILAKLFIDTSYIIYISRFFKLRINFYNIIVSFLYYPVFLIKLIVFSFSNKLEWKGREF